MGVIINNQNTKILGFALNGRPSIPSANKKYETIEIEGRDGSLTRFINYEDLKFSLTFNILFQDDIKQKLREIKGLMANAKTLSFDDSPNFFYKIKQAQVSDTESIIKRHGVFTVDFVADSFEYEASSVVQSVSPNLNLLEGTRDFSVPNWVNSGSWVTDGTYRNLTVKKRTAQWQGIYKTFKVPSDGSYTFSTYVKSSGSNASIKRFSSLNGIQYGALVTIGSDFDWIIDTMTAPNLKAGDEIFVRYEITTNTSDSILWNAGHKWEQGSTATPWMPSKSEENIYTAKLLIRNNTTYFSQPVIKIYGQGNIKLYVNDELIEFKNVMDGIILDSEKQEAYLADVNKNAQMTGNFPIFNIGENQIIATGNVNKIEILPQWRWLT